MVDQIRIEDLISTWGDELKNALWDTVGGFSNHDAYEIWCDAFEAELTLENLASLSEQDMEKIGISVCSWLELDSNKIILPTQIKQAVDGTIRHWPNR